MKSPPPRSAGRCSIATHRWMAPATTARDRGTPCTPRWRQNLQHLRGSRASAWTAAAAGILATRWRRRWLQSAPRRRRSVLLPRANRIIDPISQKAKVIGSKTHQLQHDFGPCIALLVTQVATAAGVVFQVRKTPSISLDGPVRGISAAGKMTRRLSLYSLATASWRLIPPSMSDDSSAMLDALMVSPMAMG